MAPVGSQTVKLHAQEFLLSPGKGQGRKSAERARDPETQSHQEENLAAPSGYILLEILIGVGLGPSALTFFIFSDHARRPFGVRADGAPDGLCVQPRRHGDGEDGSPARRAARFLPGHPRASFCGAS